MKDDTTALIKKAEGNLRYVELLVEEGGVEIAASRLYYAMFYVAKALLCEMDFSFSSNRAVIAAYGKHYAKTKALDPKYHRYLVAAFEL